MAGNIFCKVTIIDSNLNTMRACKEPRFFSSEEIFCVGEISGDWASMLWGNIKAKNKIIIL